MNHKKTLIISIIVSIILWTAFYFIGAALRIFVLMCRNKSCGSQLDNYLTYSIFLFPLFFVLILGLTYLISYLIERMR
ncbi:hypothetical protein GF345_01015 [Candidatus Woesearchaeota archaeon]|nr:hypothetical protein [Candidatus Woesearchaeota archaeon]